MFHLKPFCRAHPVHAPFLSLSLPAILPVTLTFSCYTTNLTSRKIKIIAEINELHLHLSSHFSLTDSAFREGRSPELLLCIVMWLLWLWWGGKAGWQLFFKNLTALTLETEVFVFSSPLPPSENHCILSRPLSSLFTSLVRRQETKLRSITKSWKAIWSPVSARRPQSSGTTGATPCKK